MGVGIQVDKLNAWFGKTQALYDINMTVAANHATAVIGPSGCGKSTFVRCLNRMHETIPEARATGRVRIGEMDVYNGTSAVQIRRRIGMVFQKANPFPTMSIYDNVAAGLTLNGFHDRKRLDEIVERGSSGGAFRFHLVYVGRVSVEDHAVVSAAKQAAHHVGAHAPQTNHTDLHFECSLFEIR